MLERVLSQVNGFSDPNVLVGFETADDAGVYQLSPDLALVQTTDFFTPVLDDPYVYGQVAAANALSDIYAMGGTPRFALSLVGFPSDDLEEEVLRLILQGGADKLKEAKVAVIGGHSVKDPELKFGYAVTGTIDPKRILTNQGAQPGDALLLTKPLGSGIISSALKFGKCPADILEAAVRWMLLLNDNLAPYLDRYPIHAATDVTGYGLLGHAFEVALHSGVCLKIVDQQVPLMEGAETFARKGLVPAGCESNRQFIGESIDWSLPRLREHLLLDPQTSGGLLLVLDPADAESLMREMEADGHFVVPIGEVVKREEAYLMVV